MLANAIKRKLHRIRLLLAAAGIAMPAAAQDAHPAITLPWIFGDHMVLQSDQDIPIWGRAEPKCQVDVRLGAVTKSTTATAAGTWRVDLPPQATHPRGRDLVVTAAEHELRLRDVVIGEVWLCAGQSNMDFSLARARGGDVAIETLRRAKRIRFCNRTGSVKGGARRLSAEQLARITPETFYSGAWQPASAEDTKDFSAVGAFFALRLRESIEAPIGLIDVSVGGSTTEGWISRQRLSQLSDLKPLLDSYLTSHLSHPFIRSRTLVHLGSWVDAGQPAPPPRHFFEPGFLFDSAIDTLAPFGLRGVLWYQGESNAHLPRIADRLFRTMVDEWRRAWRRDDLPVHFVQLPSMNRKLWPEFREVQASWRNIPHTAMAVAIDVGHPSNVHPTRKQPVGERLARTALADVYGFDLESRGPTVAAMRRSGAKLEISFDHARGLTTANDGAPTGFEVAGADRRFYPATARLHGARIVLTSPEVPSPVDARYAWAPVPAWSLRNDTGLPAAPFRTQSWRPLRIACIGDSITAGYGLKSPSTEAYPAQLQQLLGDGYRVENFGHSGCGVVLSTMRGKWQRAFRLNAEHQDALLFAPDVVISNLGINDIMAWRQTGSDFVGDYEKLIDDYRALPSAPRVLLWTPLAPLFPGQKFFGSPDQARIHEAIAQAADRTGSAKLNLQRALQGRPEWFPDHIHPDARGAAAIANTVFEGLTGEGVQAIAPRTPPAVRVYVLTGQSNSLGTTANPADHDPSPGGHAADREIRFFWSNRSTRAGDGPAVLVGDSSGQFAHLQEQQGEGANRTFWGPEVGFARALFAAGERNFVVVKASRSGGGNGFWRKGSTDDHMYRHLEETVAAALAALPAACETKVAALLYLQGESDDRNEAALSGKRLLLLANNLRSDLPNARQMRLLVGGIAAAGPNRDVVRRRQQSAVAKDGRAIYFDNTDLAAHLYDGLHFDRKAKLLIGQRFAAAWQSLGGAHAFAASAR